MPRNDARDVPDEWREAVARRIAKWVDEHAPGKTTREVAEMVGMKQPTYVQLKNKKGSFGLHLLLQVRKGFGIPLDELLNLPPIQPPAPAPVSPELQALAAQVAELLRKPPTSSSAGESPPSRPDRDSAPEPAPRRRPRT